MCTEAIYDFVVVGGGPVGLHAGLKAALLNHTALVLDKGRKWCRIWFVPRIDNIPTYPSGISGEELVNAERRALRMYRDRVELYDLFEVVDIRKEDLFHLRAINKKERKMEELESRVVILATGVVDRQPEINGSIQPILSYANKGLVHYCLLCDGHMMAGEDVAVLGHQGLAVDTALDLGWFEARSVAILTNGREMFAGESIHEDERKKRLSRLTEQGVKIIRERIVSLFGLEKILFGVRFSDGSERRFDSGMVALGLYRINNELAVKLGGKLDKEGYVLTDEDCRVLDISDNAIEGLYAVGDLRNDWNQIPIGFGDAERAVIHAHAFYL